MLRLLACIVVTIAVQKTRSNRNGDLIRQTEDLHYSRSENAVQPQRLALAEHAPAHYSRSENAVQPQRDDALVQPGAHYSRSENAVQPQPRWAVPGVPELTCH